jgi:hypothetical protein
MCDPVTLAIASVAMSGVGAMAQASQADAMRDAEIAAANREQALVNEENTRIQNEINEDAVNAAKDEVRAANDELSTIRAAAGEIGASATSETGLVVEVAYNEGVNLGRIETQRERDVESAQFAKRAGAVSALNRTTLANNRAAAAKTSAALGFAGSALNIGSKYKAQKDRLDAIKGRKG